MKYIHIAFLCLLLCGITVHAQPQQSAHFLMTKSVLDAGGARSTSTNFLLVSAFGQPSPVGAQTSAHFMLNGGFLNSSYAVSPQSPIQHLVILPAQPNVRLYWERYSGAAYYKIYRDTNPLFTPAPTNLIGTAPDTTYNDAGVVNLPATRYYYIVTAYSGIGLALHASPVVPTQIHTAENPESQGSTRLRR